MPARDLRVVAFALAVASSVSWAGAYDFKIAQLGNPQESGTNYDPGADSNFRVFARQLGAALTSVNLAPPGTLGHSGFAMSAELSRVAFSGDVQLNRAAEAFKGDLLVPSIHLRKGLPFSFEFGTRVGWIERSRMGAVTVELKWALNEGIASTPDIGVRGHLTRLLGSRDFDLTAGGLDVGLGKQFAIAGMATLTPYVGGNLVFVGASTRVVDFHADRSLADSDTGAEQFRDFDVFKPVVATANGHTRLYGGLRFIGGPVMLAIEASYSVIPSFRDLKTGDERAVPAALAFNGTVGVDF
jgi:hypothetical protein